MVRRMLNAMGYATNGRRGMAHFVTDAGSERGRRNGQQV